MDRFELDAEMHASAVSLARHRAAAYKSTFQDNFLGVCGEVAFNHWARSCTDCAPVRALYWYPWLTGTPDFYVGHRRLGVDVKTHREGADILFPKGQAGRAKATGIQVAVWAAAGPPYGPVDYDTGLVHPVVVEILGWSPIDRVAGSPTRVLMNGDVVHVIDRNTIEQIESIIAS